MVMSYRSVLYEEYSSTAQSPVMGISEATYKTREAAFQKRFEFILSMPRDASILDIGCGMGFFLKFLQNNGFDHSEGIDFSPEQVEVGKKFGVEGAQLLSWQEFLPQNQEKFDFILVDNVIEHLTRDEIVEFLKCVLASLKPKGRVYISTPNSGSVFGLPLAFIDFTHEVYFTAASLSQVINACGFAKVETSGEPLVAFDLRSRFRQICFGIIKPFIKAFYIVGTGGGGRTSIPHIVEPSLAAIAWKSDDARSA